MLQEEKKSQINLKQSEITKLEEAALKKENYIKNRCSEEFNPKIDQIDSQLKEEQRNLEEVNKGLEQWTTKKNELLAIIKTLKKNYKNSLKEKNTYLKQQLKAIAKEKKTKIDALKAEIKKLEKELEIINSV